MPKLPSLTESVGAGGNAVRVTVASLAGFYPAAHLLERPVLAVYALFAPIAFGVMSPLPGSGRRRAGTLLRAVPAAAALVLLGTLLAVSTWSAAAGVLLVGVALTYGAACAPRLAGIVPGLQLFYILACFPPYAPATLPERLAGLAVGVALLIVCETLLPQPAQPSYRARIADALDLAAQAATCLVRAVQVPDHGYVERLRTTGRDLRLSRQPAGGRPTGAGRPDRALAQAGSATRRLLDQLAALAELPAAPADMPSETLLRGIAATCAGTAQIVRGQRATAGPELMEEMTAQFLATRGSTPNARVSGLHGLLRRQSTVLTVAVSAVTVRTAVALASGVRHSVPGLPHEQFWYAEKSTGRLWIVRATGNLTPRSVVFQNAVRTALGLALARLVAGSLDLSHGFWVLLSVLTLCRTTAGATWSAVRSAAAGTLAGALAAGLLLVGAGDAIEVYEYLLAPTMLVAFSVGPVGGPAWAQGLFTLVVSTAFAQIAPVTWQLAEARLVDVLTGSAVGLMCGLLAWPSGAHSEIRRSVGALFRAAAPLVRATADAMTNPTPRQDVTAQALQLTLHRLRIAQAAYAQYRAEPAPRAAEDGPDWLAALNYGSRALVGAYWLPPSSGTADIPAAALRWAHEAAGDVAAATDRAADFPTEGVHIPLPALPSHLAAPMPPEALSLLVDLEVWLRALTADLRTATGADVHLDAKAKTGSRPHGTQ
ncbi:MULTISPECIES: FUSC family protein [unclassified Streptomyces]|uniref:FUSC family protein n=1 Tax=unclassified Streptomyces TaxID=2593676 RepID=UPI00224E9857|nr:MULTISPECIES: FUSC family protein [unclassified Streptomyces]MCX5052426.1 FUSC family protein [Streptomyces sp. NBC_00474]